MKPECYKARTECGYHDYYENKCDCDDDRPNDGLKTQNGRIGQIVTFVCLC